MCGIIAVVRRAPTRPVPSPDDVRGPLHSVAGAFRLDAVVSGGAAALVDAVERLERANSLLLGVPGLQCLQADRSLGPALATGVAEVTAAVAELERALDRSPVADIEAVNALLIRAKDACWSIERDRLRTATAVTDLAGAGVSDAGLAVYLSTQQALSALDRLEVRGRDSAGLHLLVFDHHLDVGSAGIAALVAGAVAGEGVLATV